MAEQPSYKTSTLSGLARWAVIYYGLFLGLVAVGLIANRMTLEIAEKLVAWSMVPLTMFGSAYLTARKVNGEGKPNGEVPVVPPPEVKP